MIYHCCDELRRNAVDAHPTLNGIDYLEVLDNDAPAGSPRQRTLLVRLLKPVPAAFPAEQVRIEGGERERDIRVEWVAAASAPPPEATAAEQALLAALPEPDHVLAVRVDRYGDFSPYHLRLVRSAIDPTPPPGFDPRLAEIAFSFKVECPSDFDCKPVAVCPAAPPAAPVIDYLAKDYASFRRLILDRLTQLVPDWQERNAADLGVTLVEVLAYVGDHLSYRQDAVATEAYLETARLRMSLRRHALLVDYRMHDGCNARVWLHVTAGAPTVSLPRAGTRFYSRLAEVPDRVIPDSLADRDALRAGPVVFEPLHDSTLHSAHNEIALLHLGRPALLPARRRDARDACRPPPRPRGGRRPAVRGGARAADRRAGRRRPVAPARRAAHRRAGVLARRSDRAAYRPADRRPDHRDRLGAGGRAAVPAVHLVRDRRGARRGLHRRRERRPRQHGAGRSRLHAPRRRGARHRAGPGAVPRAGPRRVVLRRARSDRDPAALPPGARLRAADLRGHRDPDDHRGRRHPHRAGGLRRARAGHGGDAVAHRGRAARHRAAGHARRRDSGLGPAARPAGERSRRPAFRGRGRARRRDAAPLRRRQPGPPARDRHGLHRALPRRQRPRRQRRRRHHRARRHDRAQRARGAQSAPGPGRHGHGGRSRRATARAGGVPPTGARGHTGRLRGGHRAPCPAYSARPRPCAGPAAGTPCSSPSTALGGVPMDAGVRGRRSRATSSATAWPATTSSSTTRSPCRSRSSSSSASRRRISAPTCAPACSRCSATAC